jgi:hypothetical protein
MTPSRILRNSSYCECVLNAADKRDISEDYLEQGMGVVSTAARMVFIILVFQNG